MILLKFSHNLFQFIKLGILLLSLATELSDLLLQAEDVGVVAIVAIDSVLERG